MCDAGPHSVLPLSPSGLRPRRTGSVGGHPKLLLGFSGTDAGASTHLTSLKSKRVALHCGMAHAAPHQFPGFPSWGEGGDRHWPPDVPVL